MRLASALRLLHLAINQRICIAVRVSFVSTGAAGAAYERGGGQRPKGQGCLQGDGGLVWCQKDRSAGTKCPTELAHAEAVLGNAG